MKSIKIALIAATALALTGCSSMPAKVCEATYTTGGDDYSISVFGVRQEGKETLLRAGYPFNFQWVSTNHFKYTTCKKAP